MPRPYQGGGRHDNPDVYGALYTSRRPESAVAEHLKRYRGQEVGDRDLREPYAYALVMLDERNVGRLVDLDEPRELIDRDLRPSTVATGQRRATQRYALDLFEEGIDGFAWWSTLEGSWINVTLFAERAAPKLRVVTEPDPLSVAHPVVAEAAEAIGVKLSGR